MTHLTNHVLSCSEVATLTRLFGSGDGLEEQQMAFGKRLGDVITWFGYPMHWVNAYTLIEVCPINQRNVRKTRYYS